MSRILAALMLTVVLLSTAAPVTAQPLTSPRTPSSWQLAWDAVWTWARLSLGVTTAKPHNKVGCGIDPNGRICE